MRQRRIMRKLRFIWLNMEKIHQRNLDIALKNFASKFRIYLICLVSMSIALDYRRAVIIFDNIVLYKVNENASEIEIYRILSTSRNLEELI